MSTHTATIRSPPESAYLTSQYGLLPSPLPPYLAANPSSNHMHPAEMSINPRYLPEPSNWAPDHYAHEQTYYAPVQIMHYPQVNQSSHLQNQNYYNAQSQLELEIVHTDQVWSLHQAIPVPPPLSQRSASPPAIHRSPEDSEDLVDNSARKPFISKLGYLLRNTELYSDVIQWDNTGTMFILAPSKRFTDEVLPELFSHSSLSAFTRQLNTYAFRHLSAVQLADTFSHSPDTFTPIKELSAWHHRLFSRDAPQECNRMAPTPSRARAASRKLKHEMLSQRGTAAAERIGSPAVAKLSKPIRIPKTPRIEKTLAAGEMVDFLQVNGGSR